MILNIWFLEATKTSLVPHVTAKRSSARCPRAVLRAAAIIRHLPPGHQGVQAVAAAVAAPAIKDQGRDNVQNRFWI
jgi:hypothetical protein